MVEVVKPRGELGTFSSAGAKPQCQLTFGYLASQDF